MFYCIKYKFVKVSFLYSRQIVDQTRVLVKIHYVGGPYIVVGPRFIRFVPNKNSSFHFSRCHIV